MAEHHAIGKPTPLVDGRIKVTGAARFAPDVAVPGMLHARLVLSLYAHARVRGIDIAAARAVPGVVTVLTAADLPPVPATSRNRLLLARDRVIFAGQPVALVVASSEAAAADGAEQVMVDYEPRPAAITIDDALADGAPLVWPTGVPKGADDAGAHGADEKEHEDQPKKARPPSNVAKESRHSRGDVAQGFALAAAVVERTFTTSMVHQSSLETQGVLVEPNPLTGGAVVYASTQAAFSVRREVAEVLGVPESDVRVQPTVIGGGFGSKFSLYEPLVALAARAVGRPIRLVLSRMDDLRAASPAPAVRIHARLGAAADGTLTALDAHVYLDNGCYPFTLAGFLAYMFGSFYRVPHFEVKGTDVLTFKPSAGAYRAPGAPVVVLALDSLIDEMAHTLGLDPLEMRLQNAAQPGDLMADGDPWPTMGMRQVLEALRAHPAWQNRQVARAAGRGVGIAVGGWPGGNEPAASVCRLERDGTLRIHVGAVDLTGTLTGFTLLAAEAFGIAPDRVRVIASDTDTAPYSGASAGSKITYTTGLAVVRAAEEARRQVLAMASEVLEAAVEDLEIRDGHVNVRGVPDHAIALLDLAKMSMEWDSPHPPIYAQGRSAQSESAPAFSAQLAEVTVDRDTGAVTIERLVAIQDVGCAINPLAIQGQMMGGATQGIGWALYEQLVYDGQGQLLTGSWMDYTVPGITEAARSIETVIVEVPSERGPFGARGVGEAPVIPTAAAIANAIADATGVRLTDLPMTAPRVWAALERASAAAPAAGAV